MYKRLITIVIIQIKILLLVITKFLSKQFFNDFLMQKYLNKVKNVLFTKKNFILFFYLN